MLKLEEKGVEILVVLLSVYGNNDGNGPERIDAEEIEGLHFENVKRDDIYQKVYSIFQPSAEQNMRILPLADFFRECNNEDIHLDDWWITYVTRNCR